MGGKQHNQSSASFVHECWLVHLHKRGRALIVSLHQVSCFGHHCILEIVNKDNVNYSTPNKHFNCQYRLSFIYFSVVCWFHYFCKELSNRQVSMNVTKTFGMNTEINLVFLCMKMNCSLEEITCIYTTNFCRLCYEEKQTFK